MNVSDIHSVRVRYHLISLFTCTDLIYILADYSYSREILRVKQETGAELHGEDQSWGCSDSNMSSSGYQCASLLTCFNNLYYLMLLYRPKPYLADQMVMPDTSKLRQIAA
jgi:hypothetical protein